VLEQDRRHRHPEFWFRMVHLTPHKRTLPSLGISNLPVDPLPKSYRDALNDARRVVTAPEFEQLEYSCTSLESAPELSDPCYRGLKPVNQPEDY
jgi:hypothetical protein